MKIDREGDRERPEMVDCNLEKMKLVAYKLTIYFFVFGQALDRCVEFYSLLPYPCKTIFCRACCSVSCHLSHSTALVRIIILVFQVRELRTRGPGCGPSWWSSWDQQWPLPLQHFASSCSALAHQFSRFSLHSCTTAQSVSKQEFTYWYNYMVWVTYNGLTRLTKERYPNHIGERDLVSGSEPNLGTIPSSPVLLSSSKKH